MVRKKTEEPKVQKVKPQFLVAINFQELGLPNQIYTFRTEQGAKDCFDHLVDLGYNCAISINPAKTSKK